jgi:UbiD family decarboxylase
MRCETVDIDVPAESELVLEGVMKAGVREDEGPLGGLPTILSVGEKSCYRTASNLP